MAGNPFDVSGDLGRVFGGASQGAKIGLRLGREWAARRAYDRVVAEYGPEVANGVSEAVKAGRDPAPIIAHAQRAREEKEERERLLASPPPLFGSARFAQTAELTKFLKPSAAFETPSSILLGTYEDDDPLGRRELSFVHWDDDGHLLTVAPTRTGKAVTTIIPNLLRYKGSVVVLDPKGELYAHTSKWRHENVGPVYRLAPFDNGTDPHTAGFARHGFNPLAFVEGERDALGLAEQMFPKDPHAVEFFADDAVVIAAATIMFVLEGAPPHLRNLATVIEQLSLPVNQLREFLQDMRSSVHPSVVQAADSVLGKSDDRGLPNLRDTLNSKLGRWRTPEILASLRQNDIDFASLKDRDATVYIEIPFHLFETFAGWQRVVLKAALDSMVRNRTVPKVQVLFVLDEFLALGPFPEFRNAIRTHAGSGVRLWFFLQDTGTLELYYPNGGWKPFFHCRVKQYFGINDFETASLIGRALGTKTLAYRVSNAGGSVGAQGTTTWTGEGGGANVGFSTGESIQFAARPLMQPDEVTELLADWKGKDWRWSLLDLSGPRTFKTRLASYEASKRCMERLGAYRPSE